MGVLEAALLCNNCLLLRCKAADACWPSQVPPRSRPLSFEHLDRQQKLWAFFFLPELKKTPFNEPLCRTHFITPAGILVSCQEQNKPLDVLSLLYRSSLKEKKPAFLAQVGCLCSLRIGSNSPEKHPRAPQVTPLL
eukprot:126092-Pelagomonas_calceolata.AAC.2